MKCCANLLMIPDLFLWLLCRHGYDSELNHELTQNQMSFVCDMSRFELMAGDPLAS